MKHIKTISIMALALMIIGIVGGLLTFNSGQPQDIAEEKTINESFKNIDISTNDATIEVATADRSNTKVELTGKTNQKYTFTAETKGDTLSIEFKEKRRWVNFNFFSRGLHLKVYVPESDYGTLEMKSNNGRVVASDIKVKEISSESDNGRIEYKNVVAEEIKGTTDNGRIVATGVEVRNITSDSDNGRIEYKDVVADNIKVDTKNGRITLENVDGHISGKSNNGRITLITKNLERTVDLKSNNGPINIQTDTEPKNARFQIKVANGKIDIFGNKEKEMIFGNGEHVIQLSSDNGNITVSK